MAGVLDRAHGVDGENADDRQIKELVAAGDTCERAPPIAPSVSNTRLLIEPAPP